MTDAERTKIVIDKVKAIYLAIMTESLPSPETLARQNTACLLAAAGIRLRAGGWRPWDAGGDELAKAMADAAFDAMEDVLDAHKALCN